jgi:hypothetical protein
VTGGIVTALLNAIEHKREKPLSWNFHRWVLLLFVLAACFLAWNDEHQKVIESTKQIENDKPKLVLIALQMMSACAEETNIVYVFFNVGVKNLGAPTEIHGWQLNIKSDSINVDRLNPVQIPDGFTLKDGNTHKIFAKFHRNNRLEENTFPPLQHNSFVGGWLMFNLPPGISLNQFTKATKTICARDVNDREYSVVYEGGKEEVMYMPGSGDNPIVNSEILNGVKQKYKH